MALAVKVNSLASGMMKVFISMRITTIWTVNMKVASATRLTI